MSKKITVYTRTTCAYCVQVKRLLDMKGKTYSVINIDEDRDARTVPVVTVTDEDGNEQVAAIGWNPGALMAAVA